ncbi:MAG TPA: hypothetical protein VFL61_16470 [Gaiellaceae bacterium]|nr:hypothetical protein [Gaiellaceae bacterium]HEU6446647.1 hypothetical protein [Gaiellaceae bacterium]
MSLDDWEQILRASTSARDASPRAKAVDPGLAPDAAANGHNASAQAAVRRVARHQPSAKELLETPDALLTRTHLRELGLERRGIDAVFRKLPIVALPGYSRPMIRVEQFLELIREHTYRDDRVRQSHA